MQIRSLASGSSGNSVLIQSDGLNILVDAGYSGRQIERLMKLAGVDPRRIDAILVTHEHSDHTAGIGVLSRRYRIPVFANEGTWLAMERKLGKIRDKDRIVFRNKRPFMLRDVQVLPIPVHHDAADPVGYTFTRVDEKIAVITDTGIVDAYLMEQIAGSDIYYFEANYEEFLLKNGSYSPWSKKRIASELGHLSNLQSAQALAELLEGRGEQVLLAHMSVNNNTAECCMRTVAEYLEGQGLDTERNLRLVVAPRFEPSAVYDTRAIRQNGLSFERTEILCKSL